MWVYTWSFFIQLQLLSSPYSVVFGFKFLFWSSLRIHRMKRQSYFLFQPFKKVCYNLFHLLSLKLWPSFNLTNLLPMTTLFTIMKTVQWPKIGLFSLNANILWLYRILSFSVHCGIVQPMFSHSFKEVLSFEVNKKAPSWNGFGAYFKGKPPLSYDTLQQLQVSIKQLWKNPFLKKLWDKPKAASLSHCKLDWACSCIIISSKLHFSDPSSPKALDAGAEIGEQISACFGFSKSMCAPVKHASVHPLTSCSMEMKTALQDHYVFLRWQLEDHVLSQLRSLNKG